MTEWILIITVHLLGNPGSIKNLEVEIVSGFTSEETCLAAAQKIGSKIVSQTSNHHALQDNEIDSKVDRPAVFTDCQKIQK